MIQRFAPKSKGATADALPFYILWVPAGADRASGKIGADVPAYCAEWKKSKNFVRCGRALGPVGRSRLTNHERITDDEKAVLWDAIGSDARQLGFSSKPSNIDAESESQTRRIREMT
ncbi:MAG: hypothetical protein WBV51_09275, partial [Pseudolabrys sp.]